MIRHITIVFKSEFRIFTSRPKIHLVYIHSRSLLPHKSKPSNWNTSHSFVQSTPLLFLLEKCNSMTQLKEIQAQMITTGLSLDRLAASRLVAFCAISDSGDLCYCERILRSIYKPNTFSWNMAIRGYAESESPINSILLYKDMLESSGSSPESGSRPDNYTYPLLFKSCARLSLVYTGNCILGHVLKWGFSSNVFVMNALIHMLVSCGDLGNAHKVFDESPEKDLVTWNSLISGYVHRSQPRTALNLYQKMKMERVRPDEVTMIGVVSLCGQLEDLCLGRESHQFIQDNGLELTVPLCNALMDMYAKCGDLEAAEILFENMTKKTKVSWTTMLVGYAKFVMLDEARSFFDKMPEKDVVPWNALIGAYIQAKRAKEALALFHEMMGAKVNPDQVTMVLCLSACSQLGALEVGIWIHRYIESKKLKLNVALGTALVDMYSKCGNVERSLEVFHEMPEKNSLTWTAIIGGLALHGNPQDALLYFSRMIDSGLLPDEITFLGVLSACCHGGLVDEGRFYFREMSSKYNLRMMPKHYSCMVDLLGRAGLLGEAEALIESMPIEADAVTWGAFFFACRIHGNVSLGQKAAHKLLQLDPEDGGIYVLLANMYGESEMWEEAREVRRLMTERGVEKNRGCSSVEVDGVVSEFIARDKSHPQTEQIYECLIQLTRQLELVESVCRSYACWMELSS